MSHSFPVTHNANPKAKPAVDQLGFGIHYTDHMFILDYTEGQGWHDGRIVPYAPISLDPAAKVFHYGQTIFEGLKAYKQSNGEIRLFRPRKNFERMNKSNARMCIPAIDGELALSALKQLVLLEQDWIPTAPGTSLYIRPYIIATEAALGVNPSRRYMFMIIMSPVGAYYAEGMNPVRINVEQEHVRAVRGGVGEAKTAGNYAASLQATEVAHKKGFTQTLWLDGVHRRYIEEVGSMNVFFKLDGVVHTPKLNGSILSGITRDSIIHMLRSWNIEVVEREITIDELVEAGRNGHLEEAWGTGTAAVISPIGELNYHDEATIIHGRTTGPLAKKLYDTLTGIQYGTLDDSFGWIERVR